MDLNMDQSIQKKFMERFQYQYNFIIIFDRS